MTMSFPYPKIGTLRRNAGEGCGSCVHRQYCQAFYWLYRNASNPSVSGKPGEVIDKYLGIQCESWSDNLNDRITTWNDDDLDFNDYYSIIDPILREPFDSGITDLVTGSDRDK